MASDGLEFTMKEVAAHKETTDAWMVIRGEVFDVTKYINDHPGGAELLVVTAGKDATEPFDYVGHSTDAFDILTNLRVGKIKGHNQIPTPKPVKLQIEAKSNIEKSSTPSKVIGAATVTLGAVGLCSGVLTAFPDVFIIPESLPLRNNDSPTGEYGLLRGFLVTSVLLGVAGSLARAFPAFLNIIEPKNSYKTFPPHQKLRKIATQDLLREGGWLHPSAYQTLPLVKKQLVAPDVYRFGFELPTKQTVLGLPIGQHVAIMAEIDGKSVARSYTPVSNNADFGVLELVIRCYPNGLLTGRYLQNLQVGDEVLFRGPKGAMRYRRGLCKRVGMLAGGTGITPMYQIIRAICEDDRDTTQVSLIYANRSEGDIVLRKELEAFARWYPKNLRLHYLLETPPEDWAYGTGRVTKEVMEEMFPPPDTDSKVMVCGPPGMVTAAKNSLVELGFEKPGLMSRMSDQIFVF
ncbi:cytochrome B5 [Biscogniauxia marginata]|nr:cytochrome B5 [Biscogniauxia marginata]